MAGPAFIQSKPFKWLESNRAMLLPLGATLLIFVLLVPLPTQMLDVLLAGNITLAAIIMLTVMYLRHPLELSSFPSLLLATTLFRLVLNVATTRLILSNGQSGMDAAGQVVRVFGDFVTAGNLTVGVIIFTILTVIQFAVITKGATRIAEVAARFTLDGMPGKQMAIDADLNAGIIDEKEARRRREEIAAEADFYGAMDGASKFVRGDAVAGLIITLVNIIGGLYVGMVEHGMPVMDCIRVYTTLTIGDGLVAAIPAFLISISAGMLVTRSSARSNLGEDLLSQLTARPVALVLAAVFLGFLSLTPLPKIPLLALAAGCGGVAFFLTTTRATAAADAAIKAKEEARKPERVESLLTIDPMELEVGYGLIRIVDRKQGGDLLDRITNIRRQTATELGIVVPPIRVRDHLRLEPNRYVVKLRGVEVARGECMPGYLLAIDNGQVSVPVPGLETREPAFGLPALWINEDLKADAEQRNYTVVPPSSVLATHLKEIIKRYADELLTREQTHRLLDTLKEKSPKAVEDVIPEVVKVGEVQRVLQNLLRERVPVRDLETILETIAEWAPRTKDTDILSEYARNALARTICQMYKDDKNVVRVVTLDPKLEDLVGAHIERSERGAFLNLPPETQNRLVRAIRDRVEQSTPSAGGQTVAVLCSPQIRMWVRRLIEPSLQHVPVLAYNEIVRGIEVQSLGLVVLNDGA
ncbi:MAG TPA: flagellar biosynthesis protein FlhA [Phycisphaerae bacterium]|nr:flagellar biosynthesis protein FlhA [Phycisphaerae bacterium]HRY69749.1 flagellar biosynthesis protein FlhA [Phycisphaerae bacterium]HSA29389.1 flagellar biosynthesis protein FlhA [Phycisphaerae bacterium]